LRKFLLIGLGFAWIAIAIASPFDANGTSNERMVTISVKELMAMKAKNNELYDDNATLSRELDKKDKIISDLQDDADTHCNNFKSASL
jgi:hypothetical protein